LEKLPEEPFSNYPRAMRGSLFISIDSPASDRPRSHTAAIAAAVVVATLVVLASRRGMTLAAPSFFVEFGSVIVPAFLADGWASALQPLQGYLTLLPRIVGGLTLILAPHHAALASTIITWLITAGILALVAAAPTLLRSGPWLAAAALFIPSGPEVFGTGVYLLWWAGLPLILLPLWDPQRRDIAPRALIAILFGLSTPFIVAVAPLMIVRAVLLRSRIETLIAGLTATCAALQTTIILSTGAGPFGFAATPPSFTDLPAILEKFIGLYAYGLEMRNASQQTYLVILGAILLLVAGAAMLRARDRWTFFVLIFLLGSGVALSLARHPVSIPDPLLAGPRYFFFPYVLLGWIFLEGAARERRWALRAAFALPLILAMVNAVQSGWSMEQADIPWTRHLASCPHFDVYGMPIQSDAGWTQGVHYADYTRPMCERLGARDQNVVEGALFPFAVRERDFAIDARQPVAILETDISGSTVVGRDSPPKGFRALSSYDGDQVTGHLTLELKRGAKLLFFGGGGVHQTYRVIAGEKVFEGPLPPCFLLSCTLEWTSDLLPERFTATFIDQGTAFGEWFAVGVPQP